MSEPTEYTYTGSKAVRSIASYEGCHPFLAPCDKVVIVRRSACDIHAVVVTRPGFTERLHRPLWVVRRDLLVDTRGTELPRLWVVPEPAPRGITMADIMEAAGLVGVAEYDAKRLATVADLIAKGEA